MYVCGMEKKCTCCGEIKDLNLFYNNKTKSKDGKFSKCKKCVDVVKRNWEKRNPKKCASYARNYQKNNKEKVREYHREYRKRDGFREYNNLKVKEWSARNKNKLLDPSKKLLDSYLIKILQKKGFKKNQITPEIIDLQRQILKNKRICKTSQN